jgi:hypothetical protein
MLLPGLDQGPLYNTLSVQFGTQFNNIVVATYPAIVTGLATPIPALRCPSDTGSSTVTIGSGTVTVFGRTNYVGVYGGIAIPAAGATAPVAASAGTFYVNSKRNFSAFTDGLSNCILVGERRSVGTQGSTPVGGDAIWAGTYASGSGPADAYILGETSTPINSTLTPPTTANNKLSGYSSLHVGGAHFVMGDGAVKFISENIFSTTYLNLASISDNQVLGDY